MSSNKLCLLLPPVCLLSFTSKISFCLLMILFPDGRIVGGVKVFVTSSYQGDFVSVQQMCSQAGGKLASPQDSAENSAVQQIAAVYNKEVFLGINYIQTEGKFRYWNGQAVIYSTWALGEPNNDINNKDCVEIHPNGFWNEQNCREKRLRPKDL
uniref:C-type lectin domain-containing protein n=1 Tax=Crocodylus porosus TaxID=8502 RepID=A0A7M4ETD2_CROPO